MGEFIRRLISLKSLSAINSVATDLQNKDSEQDQSIAANTSAIEGKVNIAQGAENAGKALIVGSDGNVVPGDVDGGKQLFTGTLNDLITLDGNILTIVKDFEIRAIKLRDSSTEEIIYYSFTVNKGTIVFDTTSNKRKIVFNNTRYYESNFYSYLTVVAEMGNLSFAMTFGTNSINQSTSSEINWTNIKRGCYQIFV